MGNTHLKNSPFSDCKIKKIAIVSGTPKETIKKNEKLEKCTYIDKLEVVSRLHEFVK